MPQKPIESVREKTRAILAEGVGRELAGSLRLGVDEIVHGAVRRAYPELDERAAFDLAFHLTDWREDAAFLVALALDPGRFTDEEVQEGISNFLVHAPNHVAAAAKIGGWPIEDIFELGVLDPTDRGRAS